MPPFWLLLLSLFSGCDSRGQPPSILPTWIKKAPTTTTRPLLRAPPPRTLSPLRSPRPTRPLPPPPPPSTTIAPPSTVRSFATIKDNHVVSESRFPPSGWRFLSDGRISISPRVKAFLRAARNVKGPMPPPPILPSKDAIPLSLHEDITAPSTAPNAQGSSPARSFSQIVSMDGSHSISTSDDMLVAVKKASPLLAAALSEAEKTIQEEYAEAIKDIQDIFQEVAADLKAAAPDSASALTAAKKKVEEKLKDAKTQGQAVTREATAKAAQLVSTLPDQHYDQLVSIFEPYFTYDNGLELLGSLSTTMPTFYSSVQKANEPVHNAAQKMKSTVEKYVQDTMTGMRSKYPPSEKTINELEKKLKQEIDSISNKAIKKMDGMMSYETAKAVTALNPQESSQISVVQTGPGFSLVSVQSAAPSFSSALNGSEERVLAVFEDYRLHLEPFISGPLLDPQIFNAAPQHEEKTKTVKELLNDLRKEVGEYMKKGHSAAAVDAAKSVSAEKGGKQKLQQQMANSSVYLYTPMLLSSFYSYSPVLAGQAVDLSAWTAQQLQATKEEAANYAFTLVLNVFGQYEWAAVPINKMASKLQKNGEQLQTTVNTVLPHAMMQAIHEQPKKAKHAVQQILLMYYIPYAGGPFFG